MTLAVDVFGHEYDSAACPAFIDCGDLYWFHMPTGRLLTKASVTAWLSAHSASFASGESGALPLAYQSNHTGLPTHTAVIAADAVEDDEASGTITFSGGLAPADTTVTVTVEAAETAIAGISAVDISEGDSPETVAAAVAAELDDKQDVGTTYTLHAVASGAVVTVTEDGAANITTLTAVVA